jgi:phospholipid/cholesterol/gamma-HCH transport system substrate-binding protein
MSVKIHYFRIGLFVLTAGALFVGALFFMGLRGYFGQRDVFETYVAGKVENLSVGALVKLRGVTIGKVSAIEFVGAEYPQYGDQYVLIQFEVPRGTVWSADADKLQQAVSAEIAQGLRARVQGQGFIGASIVALEYTDPTLYPVEPVPWKPKHYYIPSAPSQLNQVFASLEKSLRHVEDLDLGELLVRAKALIDGANRLVTNVDQIDFKQLGTNAEVLLDEVRDSNRSLQHTLADARNAINGADLPTISRDTTALEAKLSAAVMELRHVLASVNTGELNDSLANIRAASDDLVVLLHNLQQRPSSVIFSKPAEPVPELETPPRK